MNDYLTMETEFPMDAHQLEDLQVDGWKLVTVVGLADRQYIKYLTYFIREKKQLNEYAPILAEGDMSI